MGVSVNNQDNKQDNHLTFMNLEDVINVGNVGGNTGGGIGSSTSGSIKVTPVLINLQGLDLQNLQAGSYGGKGLINLQQYDLESLAGECSLTCPSGTLVYPCRCATLAFN